MAFWKTVSSYSVVILSMINDFTYCNVVRFDIRTIYIIEVSLPSELPHSHVLYALRTLTCCLFLVFALPLPPVVLVLQPPLCGTRSHLASATFPLPIPSVVFLKLTASSRLSAPLSGSPKCLRFSLWLTLCTLNIYLLTYLLTCLLTDIYWPILQWISLGDI